MSWVLPWEVGWLPLSFPGEVLSQGLPSLPPSPKLPHVTLSRQGEQTAPCLASCLPILASPAERA